MRRSRVQDLTKLGSVSEKVWYRVSSNSAKLYAFIIFLNWTVLAYGTRARNARGSQNCAILSIIRLFTGKGALCLSVNNVVVSLPCRKDATKVFFREVNANKDIMNTVLPSFYT